MKTQGAQVTLTGHPVCTQTCGVTQPFDVMCRNSQCRNDLILDSSKLWTQNRTPHRFLSPLVCIVYTQHLHMYSTFGIQS